MEPDQLLRGKLFHNKVQIDWEGFIEGKPVRPEYGIILKTNPEIAKKVKRGRIDIFVDKMSDFVTIVEIKSTDWNKIKAHNVKRLLQSHSRQMFKYIDKFLEIDKVNVCAAIIYPKAPKSSKLKNTIEDYFNENSFQLVWHEDW